MRAYQLFVWILVILALGLVLFDKLHDVSAVAAHQFANVVQLDLTRIDLERLSSESNARESRETSNEASIAAPQVTQTTLETSAHTTE